MARTCESCKAPIDFGTAARRFCNDTCRKRASRAKTAPVAPPPVAAAGPSASTRDAVLAELEEACKQDSYLGRAALALADRIDQSTAVMGFAALVKELRSTMEDVLAGVHVEQDPVDELRERRDGKRRAG